MFQPKYLKQAKLLDKGVKKFLNYKRDILQADDLAAIASLHENFRSAVKAKDKELVKKTAKDLTKLCEKSVPNLGNSSLRENIEVIFVALVIAIGIRSYFLQPFKIPTGSMQPTLNGIIAEDYSQSKEFEMPNLVVRAFDKVAMGKSWIQKTMPRDGQLIEIVEETRFKFWTYTTFVFTDPSLNFSIPATFAAVVPQETGRLGVAAKFGIRPEKRVAPGTRVGMFGVVNEGIAFQPVYLAKGTLVAQCLVQTGDQVLVDKFSYHFRRPNRGEVIVFETTDLDFPRETPAKHYIKRLAAVPGDQMRLVPSDKENPYPESGQILAELMIDGKIATEKGFRRVAEREDPRYRGYVIDDRMPRNSFDLPGLDEPIEEWGTRKYVALGDNSRSSADSREWGTVPERNLVGPAFGVYWPFGSHWGLSK